MVKAAQMRFRMGEICPSLDMAGGWFNIMYRVTAEQLAVLLDAAERDEDAEMWSEIASRFMQHGREAIIVAHANRLIALVKCSYNASLVLIYVPCLNEAQRDVLVGRVVDISHAAWTLCHAPGLTDAQRGRLEQVCNKED